MALTDDGGDWIAKPAALPSDKGAYILRIVLEKPAPLPPRFGKGVLEPGLYFYFGSANGPGGIKARVTRHMKKRKTKRWHIDWLTTRAASVTAQVFLGGNECALRAEAAQDDPTLSVPVAHFGASDCKTCPAHLLKRRA